MEKNINTERSIMASIEKIDNTIKLLIEAYKRSNILVDSL